MPFAAAMSATRRLAVMRFARMPRHCTGHARVNALGFLGSVAFHAAFTWSIGDTNHREANEKRTA